MSQRKRQIFIHEFLTRCKSSSDPDGIVGWFFEALGEVGKKMELDLDELRHRYYEQLPTIAAMIMPEGKFKPEQLAREAIGLVETILEVLEESVNDEDDND